MHVDLNLLTAFDALLDEGSVGAAAERLHLSQPAMSRTLGRLRRATGDQILVRTGRAMTPTPYALAVRAEVHALVRQARAVLAPERELDLDTLARTFTLRCHDAITTAIGPGLVAAVRAEAPGVRLRLLAETDVDTHDLRQGRVDLEVGSARGAEPDVRTETVAHDRLVVAARPAHPCLQGALTTAGYARASHVIVSRRGRLRDPVDDALEARGLARTVVAAAPTSTAALHLVRASDVIVTVPAAMCGSVVRALGLRTAAVPLDLRPVLIVLAWHGRDEGDRAHAWLRARVREALAAVCAAGGADAGRGPART